MYDCALEYAHIHTHVNRVAHAHAQYQNINF